MPRRRRAAAAAGRRLQRRDRRRRVAGVAVRISLARAAGRTAARRLGAAHRRGGRGLGRRRRGDGRRRARRAGVPVRHPGQHRRDAGAERRRVRGGDRRRARRRRPLRPARRSCAASPAADLGLGLPRERPQAPRRRDRAAGAVPRCAGDGRSAPIRYPELARDARRRSRGTAVPAAAAREAVLALRRGKGMVLDAADHDTWSVGSFFTNPVLPAARRRTDPAPRWPVGPGPGEAVGGLADRARRLPPRPSGPGGRVGAVRPSTCSRSATGAAAPTADLLALAAEVRDGVQDRFGVELSPEPVLVGCAL